MKDTANIVGNAVGGTNQINNITYTDSNRIQPEFSPNMQAFSLELSRQLVKFMTNVNESQSSQGSGEEGAKYDDKKGQTAAVISHYQSTNGDPSITLTRAIEGIIVTLEDSKKGNDEKVVAVKNLNEIIAGLFDRATDSASELFHLARMVGKSFGTSTKDILSGIFR